MTARRILSTVTLLAVGSLVGLVACSSDAPDEPASELDLRGQYAATSVEEDAPSGTLQTVEFAAGSRYTAVRACRGCTPTPEQGHYQVHGETIVFVNDATKESVTLPFAIAKKPAAGAGGLVGKQTLTGETGNVTNETGNVTNEAGKLTTEQMLLDGKQYALLRCGGGAGVCSKVGCYGSLTTIAGGAGDCGWTIRGVGGPKFVSSDAIACCQPPGFG